MKKSWAALAQLLIPLYGIGVLKNLLKRYYPASARCEVCGLSPVVTYQGEPLRCAYHVED